MLSILLVLVLLKHYNMWKTEAVIKISLQNSCSYYFLWTKRSYLHFQENARKIFLNKFTFNAVTFQIFFQGFYLGFKVLLLRSFRFPRACIFHNTSFTHPFMLAWLGIMRQLTGWENDKVARIFDNKLEDDGLWGKIKFLDPTLWSWYVPGLVSGL